MSTSTPTAASGSVTGGASDFFDASPGANQQTPAVTTQPITGSALAGGGASDFFGAPSTSPSIPKPAERKRQFSHRLSSLEKATHDPTSFQYADPLEGRATIVAGRGNVVGANVAGSSNVATTSVGGANVTETENVGDIGATIDSGASYSPYINFRQHLPRVDSRPWRLEELTSLTALLRRRLRLVHQLSLL